ncbi:MAG: family 10 glycosylhydrolase [Muribaculaceae bacterium]|nr:family 10 glycosylhydrolase [Muribaculaceae bacterium]
MKRICLLLQLVVVLTGCLSAGESISQGASLPKHEFRGAWMHIIGQGQYARMTPDETRQYLIEQLDLLEQANCNAVIWQIRPQADAAYKSELEPWSRWLSGEPGKAPQPIWDPLQFMIEQTHQRGMELHAWINPYRVTSSEEDKPAPGHIYYEHPEWFLKYADGKLYFDPGLPECRDFIDTVVRDILVRYDIDALHMDDYFYPYPVTGVDFPDTTSYNIYGIGWDKNDWRRHNVDLLIEQLHNTIQEVKPWVRFGISPFGIWRNKASDPDGSETNGLECYDALFADCIKWTAEGWVDYMVPQLYWELEHKLASDLVLMHWWNDHANGRHMYFGQAVRNVMTHQDIADEGGDTSNPTQLDHKMRLQRAMKDVHGVTWWPGYTVTENFKGVLDSLEGNQTRYKALIPAYTWLDDKAPQAVHDVKVKKVDGKKCLVWRARATDDAMQQAVRFVIYRFPKGKKGDISNPSNIFEITNETSLVLPDGGKGKWQYAVTALDRCWNESAPAWTK